METQSSTPNVTGATPGPWRVEDVAVNGSLAIMAGSATEYRWLATVSEDLEAGIDWTQTQANARVIAAAPELRQTTGELHRLLREWRRTPFFEDATEWQRWVDDFGVRVDQATDMAVTVLRKVTEVQP